MSMILAITLRSEIAQNASHTKNALKCRIAQLQNRNERDADTSLRDDLPGIVCVEPKYQATDGLSPDLSSNSFGSRPSMTVSRNLVRSTNPATALFAILSLSCVGLASSEETYGSWAVSLSDDKTSIYALTVNDSGGALGEFCYPEKGSCVWMLGMSSSCEEGNDYPVLANSDAGSIQLQVKCNGKMPNGMYSYAFTKFDDVDHLVKSGARVGFAVPLQSDQFTVVRFSLNGSTSAVQRMRAVADTMNVGGNKRKSTGTQDQTI